MRDLLRPVQVARITGLTLAEIFRQIEKGSLPAVVRNGRYRIKQADVDQLVARQKTSRAAALISDLAARAGASMTRDEAEFLASVEADYQARLEREIAGQISYYNQMTALRAGELEQAERHRKRAEAARRERREK